MNIKIIEVLKEQSSQTDDEEFVKLVNYSFSTYTKDTITNPLLFKDDKSKVSYSHLIRFYRSLNSNKKQGDDFYVNLLKELCKGRSKSFSSLKDKIGTILTHQTERIQFSNEQTEPGLLPFVLQPKKINSLDALSVINSIICDVKDFSFKININISSNLSNRLLTPEIIFYFTLSDGRTHRLKIDINVFQELRKSIAFHVKKILDNEAVNLLK